MFKDIDFGVMYKEHRAATTFRKKREDEWDEKAEAFDGRVHVSPYVNDFISRINFGGCESAIDIGCGPGTLALPLAKILNRVTALDFSDKMLGCLQKNADKKGLRNIVARKLAWEDSWDDISQHDIAVASRSIEVDDLEDALFKLNKIAKKRVYLTYKVGGSFVDECILDFIGAKVVPKPDYIYISALLYNMGIHCKIDFIDTTAASISYCLQEEFVSSLNWSLGELSGEQKTKAEKFYEQFVATGKFSSKAQQWAFISWEKER